jgi:hypothetical protein
MKPSIGIHKYLDERNTNDKGNNCYYLAVANCPYGKSEIEDRFFSLEIDDEFSVDYLSIAKKYGGFLDGRDIFFKYKYQAEEAKKELKLVLAK